MSRAAIELQKAIVGSLRTAAPLVSLLGDAKVFDDVPRGTTPPYIALAQSSSSDWSTGSEAGEEHALTFHVWSSVSGKREALAVAQAVRDRLEDVPLSLETHRLVNLRHEYTEVRRENDGGSYRGLVRFRAVTEPLD